MAFRDGFPEYNYGSSIRPASWVSGTVIRGSRHAGTRKGETFNAGNRTVIENRVEGRVRSFTVIGSDGRAEARLAPDARVW